MQIDETVGARKNEIFDFRRYKTRLFAHLTELSRKVQQSKRPPHHQYGAAILAVDEDGLEYIENIIFDLFNVILLTNTDLEQQYGAGSTPEAQCSAAIASISLRNTSSSVVSSPRLTKKGQPIATSNQIVLNDSGLDVNEIEQRVRQIFPRVLADPACSKAQNTVNECRKFAKSANKSRLFRNLR